MSCIVVTTIMYTNTWKKKKIFCFVLKYIYIYFFNTKRGKILANLGKESPCYKIVEIDLNYIDKVRHQMPLHNSFRSDLYLQIPFVLSINIFYLFSFNISL